MKRKISICSAKSNNYLFNNFLKQFRKALEHQSAGQMLSSKQVLSVLCYMGFVQQFPTPQDLQLAKTITKMLSDSHSLLSVRRMNLFKFLTSKQSAQGSYFQEETQGLAIDIEDQCQPIIVIELGYFENGRWNCSMQEKEQIKSVFASMRAHRMSRSQIESRKRSTKQQQEVRNSFQPKICPKSHMIFSQKLKKVNRNNPLNEKVENRLILSRNVFKAKIQQQLNRSLDKQLQKCTFKPVINSRSKNKENIEPRHNSQDHLRQLFGKGEAYKKKQEKLRELKIKINESTELDGCTFKPQTTKHSQSSKWVCVRNRDKQIQRLREGRRQRDYLNQVKERGYPQGVNWSQFISSKTLDKQKQPILCIDLKILNQQHNINVYEGENIISIADAINKQYNVPEGMWWKLQQLVRKAVEQCDNIKVQNNKIFATR